MPQPDEIIRSHVETWSNEQAEYATHWNETLQALEAYETFLDQWQEQLARQADSIVQRDRELEERRRQLMKQHTADVAMTAELDQARAEIEELRTRLATKLTPAGATAPTDSTHTSSATTPAKSNTAAELVEPSMNSVAKQFHKLRQQQAARRSTARAAEKQ